MSFKAMEFVQMRPDTTQAGHEYHKIVPEGALAEITGEFGTLITYLGEQSDKEFGAWVWRGQLKESPYSTSIVLNEWLFNCKANNGAQLDKDASVTMIIGISSVNWPGVISAYYSTELKVVECNDGSRGYQLVAENVGDLAITPGTYVTIALILPTNLTPRIAGSVKIQSVTVPDHGWPLIEVPIKQGSVS